MTQELTDEQKQIMKGKICPYCKGASVLVDSSEIYGQSYGNIYLCRPCRAYVGTHHGADKAKGRLANAELRELKTQAHEAFDKLWKFKYMKRSAAYAWLSESLNLPRKYTHIGMFNHATTKKVIALSKSKLKSFK